MEILGQTPVQTILFIVIYTITGVVPLMAALYLLLRRANAIAPDVTSPVRVRRWAAAFFGVSALGHVWWLLFYYFSRSLSYMDEMRLSAGYMAVVVLDFLTLLPTIAGTLLAMLQDRRRPVWPVFAATLPFVVLGGMVVVRPDLQLLRVGIFYVLLLYVLFTVYMAFALRHYGRWLRDNYANLERKEVWQTHVLSFVFMLLLIFYAIVDIDSLVLLYVLHFIELALFCFLLWRVETLPQLNAESEEEAYTPSAPERQVCETASESTFVPETMPIIPTQPEQPSANPINIDVDQMEQLLKEHCVATQLYLEPELTLQKLAQTVGTNRYYLSQYFSRQGITYNTYINNLRVNHFISRCNALTAAGESVSAKNLAHESGFSSYRTFSRAFLLRTGQSVTVWLNGGVIIWLNCQVIKKIVVYLHQVTIKQEIIWQQKSQDTTRHSPLSRRGMWQKNSTTVTNWSW